MCDIRICKIKSVSNNQEYIIYTNKNYKLGECICFNYLHAPLNVRQENILIKDYYTLVKKSKMFTILKEIIDAAHNISPLNKYDIFKEEVIEYERWELDECKEDYMKKIENNNSKLKTYKDMFKDKELPTKRNSSVGLYKTGLAFKKFVKENIKDVKCENEYADEGEIYDILWELYKNYKF